MDPLRPEPTDDDDLAEIREDGPLPLDVPPTIPAHPHPERRTFVATTAEYARWKLSRIGLSADLAIEDELEDHRRGFGYYRDRGYTPDEYAAEQPDVAIWEGERLVATIRPLPGGEPEVTRFDDPALARSGPSTELEHIIWGMIREFGADRSHDVLSEHFILKPMRDRIPLLSASTTPRVLTDDERSAVSLLAGLGPREFFDRVTLAGPYRLISDVRDRIGTDAVAELRRLIEAGRIAAPECRADVG